MKRMLCTLALGLLATATVHAAKASPDFQIVESVPEATIYGQPGVPRTQQVWLQMIRGAQHSIDIAAFYITGFSRTAR